MILLSFCTRENSLPRSAFRRRRQTEVCVVECSQKYHIGTGLNLAVTLYGTLKRVENLYPMKNLAFIQWEQRFCMDPLPLNGMCLLAAEKSSRTWRQSALVWMGGLWLAKKQYVQGLLVTKSEWLKLLPWYKVYNKFRGSGLACHIHP